MYTQTQQMKNAKSIQKDAPHKTLRYQKKLEEGRIFVRSFSHYCKNRDIMGKIPKFQHSITKILIHHSYFLHIISTKVDKTEEKKKDFGSGRVSCGKYLVDTRKNTPFYCY
jgi:hypothetical protein